MFLILEPARLLGACKPGSRARMVSRTGHVWVLVRMNIYNGLYQDEEANLVIGLLLQRRNWDNQRPGKDFWFLIILEISLSCLVYVCTRICRGWLQYKKCFCCSREKVFLFWPSSSLNLSGVRLHLRHGRCVRLWDNASERDAHSSRRDSPSLPQADCSG